MNRENIIKLAREAGWQYADDDRGYEPLWRFAALVADAEREACAKVCEQVSKDFGGVAEGPFVTDFGKHTHMSMAVGAENCVAAIRARVN